VLFLSCAPRIRSELLIASPIFRNVSRIAMLLDSAKAFALAFGRQTTLGFWRIAHAQYLSRLTE
jgi:hypothetical protein